MTTVHTEAAACLLDCPFLARKCSASSCMAWEPRTETKSESLEPPAEIRAAVAPLSDEWASLANADGEIDEARIAALRAAIADLLRPWFDACMAGRGFASPDADATESADGLTSFAGGYTVADEMGAILETCSDGAEDMMLSIDIETETFVGGTCRRIET